MRPRRARQTRRHHAYRILVVLPDTDPLVWRRLLVPESYSFWDLHVAIQDAMGWLDYHLHEFELVDRKGERVVRIGIPDFDTPDERPCLAGWDVPIRQHLLPGMSPVRYRYDLGDDWEHTIELEEILPTDGGDYPRCAAGAGACPPEDVGGTSGYRRFLRAIADPGDPEHTEFLEWVGGSFDANAFDPEAVHFDDPLARWKYAFEDGGEPDA